MAGAVAALRRSDTPPVAQEAGPYRRPGLVIGTVGLGSALILGAASAFGPLVGLLVLAAVPVALLVLARPDLGAYMLVAAVPVVSGVQRGLPIPGLRLSEIFIGGLSTIILVTARNDQARPWRAFDWLALGYASATFGLGLTQLFSRGEALTSDTLGTLIGPFQYLLLYRAVLVALPDAAQQHRVLRLVLLASIPVSLSALFQNFHLLGVRQLIPSITGVNVDTAYDDAYGTNAQGGGDRATGTFPHWQVLGGYEFWILLLSSATMLSKKPVLSRKWLLVVMALAAGGAFSTVTLTIIITAAVGGVLLTVWYGKIAWVLPALAIGAAVGLPAFGSSLHARVDEQFSNAVNRPAWVPDTMDYRYRLWRDQYLPLIREGRWWTGYGPDSPPNLSFAFTESLYITLMLRGGLPLLLLYVALTVVLVTAAIRARGDPDPARRAAARTIAVGSLLLVPMHFVEPYFVLTGMAPLFWITAAVVMGTAPAREGVRTRFRRPDSRAAVAPAPGV
jgi:hypothetical protein